MCAGAKSFRFFSCRSQRFTSRSAGNADISVLAIATYATDYLLVKGENIERALLVLEQSGHSIDRQVD